MIKLSCCMIAFCCLTLKLGHCEPTDKDYIRIDDMLFPKESGPSIRAGIVDKAWPRGEIPYKLDKSLTDEYPDLVVTIHGAMEELSRRSCLKFRPATAMDRYWVLYWVTLQFPITPNPIGWQNEKDQPIGLGPTYVEGNVIHETMHALGFLHETTRDDRDEFVIINYKNMMKEYRSTLNKDSESGFKRTSYYGVPYNYESIMHYKATDYSIYPDDPSKLTIISKNNPNGIGDPENMGQRDGLTQGDIIMINRKYNCSAKVSNNCKKASLILRETPKGS